MAIDYLPTTALDNISITMTASSIWACWSRRLFSRKAHSPSDSGPVALDPWLFYVSPLQLWLDGLVYVVGKAETLDNTWLPIFSVASSHLRLVFSRIHHEHCPTAAFLLQWEVGGMLLLGFVLEASVLQMSATRRLCVR